MSNEYNRLYGVVQELRDRIKEYEKFMDHACCDVVIVDVDGVCYDDLETAFEAWKEAER